MKDVVSEISHLNVNLSGQKKNIEKYMFAIHTRVRFYVFETGGIR